MSFFAYAFLIAGLLIIVYIFLSNQKDWVKDWYESIRIKYKQKRKAKEEQYKYEVVVTKTYEDYFKEHFLLVQKLKHILQITKIKVKTQRISGNFDQEVKMGNITLDKLELENEFLRNQIEFYNILDRAKANLINVQSDIELRKWARFEAFLSDLDFSNLHPTTQSTILNSLSFNYQKSNNIDDYYSHVRMDIENDISKENLRDKKMKNDFEQKKQERKNNA